jgi:hypothetical protein
VTPPAATTAPTWTPQSAQDKWSDRSGRGNFNDAWGVSSPARSGRVMPKPYGARYEGIQRDSRRVLPPSVNLDVCRIELGPSRRDPQGTFRKHAKHEWSGDTQNVLQGASAMGSFAVTRRVSRRVSERQPSLLIERSTSFDFGVRVATRSAHANRVCMQSASILDAACRYTSNHQRGVKVAEDQSTRRCSLQNGLHVSANKVRVLGAAHGVHG